MFAHPLRGALAEKRARVKRDASICAKSSTFGYFVGTSPITGEGNQLRSPTPIMAPVDNHQIAKYLTELYDFISVLYFYLLLRKVITTADWANLGRTLTE